MSYHIPPCEHEQHAIVRAAQDVAVWSLIVRRARAEGRDARQLGELLPAGGLALADAEIGEGLLVFWRSCRSTARRIAPL